jgi:hypothetical protein
MTPAGSRRSRHQRSTLLFQVGLKVNHLCLPSPASDRANRTRRDAKEMNLTKKAPLPYQGTVEWTGRGQRAARTARHHTPSACAVRRVCGDEPAAPACDDRQRCLAGMDVPTAIGSTCRSGNCCSTCRRGKTAHTGPPGDRAGPRPPTAPRARPRTPRPRHGGAGARERRRRAHAADRIDRQPDPARARDAGAALGRPGARPVPGGLRAPGAHDPAPTHVLCPPRARARRAEALAPPQITGHAVVATRQWLRAAPPHG